VQFPAVFDFATAGESSFGSLRDKPSRTTGGILRHADAADLQEIRFYGKLADPRRFPEHALAVQINVEMRPSDVSHRASFFPSLIGGGLAMREMRLDAAFGKGPFAGISFDQKKLDSAAAVAIADGRHLARQLSDQAIRCG